jgi:signal transduction histidine kinase
MGLFVSYGIVREHQGRLLYEGDKRGAVFTVVLPAASGVAEPARISRPV